MYYNIGPSRHFSLLEIIVSVRPRSTSSLFRQTFDEVGKNFSLETCSNVFSSSMLLIRNKLECLSLEIFFRANEKWTYPIEQHTF
jgi:hypothetical protein